MQEIIFPFTGGLGLFLIGMMLLSQGLVAFGGGAMKRALARFTGTPTKAFLSGTLATMAVQSSTATTVTLIGFVSAGLITFSQAIGVLIGASLGNTATGWIIASLGLKVSLGFYTLPMIGIGALFKLLARGGLRDLGMAMAGFGMLFLGLDTLRDGMQGLSQAFDLAALPAGGFLALVAAMLIGLALTAVLQSSTAAIATTLTALHTQAINFEQAAALVVGAAIGTTLTGALVAIGGTIYAKRTALAYVLFNAVAGVLAIVLLPVFLRVIGWLGSQAGLGAGATSLAAFHTLFIAVGVVLFLPFVQPFARLVERLMPETGDPGTQRLDDSLLSIPAVALEASQRALEEVTLRLLAVYEAMLSAPHVPAHAMQLRQVEPVLDGAYDFVSRIQVQSGDTVNGAQRIAQLHAIDHLLRLRTRLYDLAAADADLTTPEYAWALENTREILQRARQGLLEGNLQEQLEELQRHAEQLSTRSRAGRYALLKATNPDPGAAVHTLRQTDIFRAIDRIGSHIWRMSLYLSQGRLTGLVQPALEGDREAPTPSAPPAVVRQD